ncbi:MAG: PstS family phosphate ABC transporter substrate-binding protein [Dietzia sp.]
MKASVRTASLSGVAVLALVLSACGGDEGSNGASGAEGEGSDLSGQISIDGSSTVTPHTVPASELFMNENPGVQIAVATSGTGGGFEKFCAGETDISMASRPIKETEIEACAANGIAYEQVAVANDGLAVIVNPENDWATCMTVDELSQFWATDAQATSWSDVNGEWADETVQLYGPGSDSGTYDYFTEAVNGEEGNITARYTDIGEDDNAAIDGVSSSIGAMGFVPLSFVEESGDAVKAIEIENEAGECVAPTEETVRDGSYNPLGRQLYIYPSDQALQREEVVAFLEFYIQNQTEVAEEALFIPLTDEQEQLALDQVAELANG